ncbi:MAG TPA: hypothetical protein VHD85_19075 [Terracidiphilus sp.]|nr:hypothetical protein [Terracidiphilus sp.]
MPEAFQRLFTMSGPEALSLNAQAALGEVVQPERSQFAHLVRHYLERFFNHETASPDGDAKARLVQTACAAGLPPLIVATYLWPIYHPVVEYTMRHHALPGPPPYWLQVNHHLFFVLYSFVVMGIITVYEWDLFFPDLLDIFVLGALPIHTRRLFRARVSAISMFIAGFLFDSNILAPLVLPEAIDPPSATRFDAAHVLATFGAGLFAALAVIAIQSALLAVFGERLFRKLSLVFQGLAISLLLVLLLLFPVLSGAVPALLRSGSLVARCFPPLWFLGIDQYVLDGPSALPIYAQLAHTAFIATAAVATLALIAYPLAYLRRVRQLIEGSVTRKARNPLTRIFHPLLHSTIVRSPVRRAVFHFIGQTLIRVPRYRIYLVLYCGVGLSVVTASVLRLTVTHNQLRMAISADGLRSAIAIVVFWVVAGLRSAFVSPGNQRASWVFRIVHGNPPTFTTALDRLQAAKTWTFTIALAVTIAAQFASRLIAPPELLTAASTTAQFLVAIALCLLLTDAFFLHVTTVPFTGAPSSEEPNLAFTLLKYFTFFPLIIVLPIAAEAWIEQKPWHFAAAAASVIAAHIALRFRHRAIIAAHCRQLPLEEDEEDFPMRLGLRY